MLHKKYSAKGMEVHLIMLLGIIYENRIKNCIYNQEVLIYSSYMTTEYSIK